MAKIVKATTEVPPEVENLPEFEASVDNIQEQATIETIGDLPETTEPTINPDELRQYESDHRYVQVRTRVNIPRTRICGQWYNFVAGKVSTVPKFVRDWLDEQGVL